MWRRADIRVRIRPKLSAGIFFSQQSRWEGRSMFRLHKWYLDVVTDTGDVLILYAGTVEWGRIAFDYASVLQYRDGVTRDVQSVRRVAQPRLQADAVTWRSGPLRVEGQWIRDAQEIQRTLVNGPDGLINWTCHMPRAQATVQFQGEKIAGLGYVESLTLSIPPSKLPFRTLRWGRHLSDRHWIVWIGWTGCGDRLWIWMDGEEQPAAALVDGAPSRLNGGARLRLSSPRDVRDRNVLESLTGVPAAMTRRIAGSLANVHEHKQVSRSSLVIADQAIDHGWALHEVVTR